MEEENKTIQNVEQKPLSKREKKRLAKQEKKQRKKEKKLADKEFERNHPLRKRKIAAWIVELVGLVILAVPGVIFVGLFIAALGAFIVGALILLLLAMGFIFFGIGYFIYAGTTDNPSPEGYFSSGTRILDWGNSLINIMDTLNGWFLTIFGGVSLVINLVGFILLLTSLNACSKKHKVTYIILMVLIILASVGILVSGLTKVMPLSAPAVPPTE